MLAPCPGQDPVGLIPPLFRFLLGGQIAPQSPHAKLLGPLLVQAKPDVHPPSPPGSQVWSCDPIPADEMSTSVGQNFWEGSLKVADSPGKRSLCPLHFFFPAS